MPHAKRAAASPRRVVKRKARAPRKPAAPRRKPARKFVSRKPAPLARKRRPPPREADPFAKKTGRRRNYYTAEFLAEARRRVEHTSQSTTSIAIDFGMHHSVLSGLIKRQGWVRPEASLRRRGLAPVMRIAAAVDEMVSGTSTPTLPLAGGGSPTAFAAPAPHDTSAIDRLEAAVLKELATVETMRASLQSEPLRPMDAERTARTLSTLTETLAKLRRLRLGAQPQSGSFHDDMPADIDEFRRQLARRINLFVASRTGGGDAGRDAGPVVVDDAR